jgi:hypothetical protein
LRLVRSVFWLALPMPVIALRESSAGAIPMHLASD